MKVGWGRKKGGTRKEGRKGEGARNLTFLRVFSSSSMGMAAVAAAGAEAAGTRIGHSSSSSKVVDM